ncbi:DUF6443 domain-containing protein, partial [Flavobacterium macrobrachii]|uniref:DUF6443 domain-containing protein n=1 Tax=Flavobacterium macrobrachii TaxID=591204 RepID=UPI0037BEBCEE
MRKYIVLILFLLSLKLYSQIAIDVPQITRPSPSQNGIANFNEIQVNTFTGVPDISIPLMGLPTRAKEISVDLSLQYHPSGVSVYNGVSDVGMGWNLFGGGQITRKIIGKPDKYCSTGSQALCDNQGMFTDEYNYSFMGFGGRFKLVKNATTGVYEVQHMDLTPLKIEFEISSTDNTIASFTIYDTHGFQYLFGIKNRLQGSFNQGRNSISFEEYSDTYQITRVKDNNNNILLSFTYENFSFQGFSNSQYIDITYNKLKKIISPGFGSITFNLDFTTSYINGLNDPFQINGVILKDSNETVIKNMVLEYNIVNYIAARRMLNKVTYWDNNNTNSKVYRLNYNSMLKPSFFCDEDYGFDYDNFGYISLKQIAGFMNETAGITIPEVVKSGVLNSIQLPTGGSIEYDFESNSYPFEFYSSNESNSTELRRNPYNIDFNNYATYYYLSSGSTTRELTVTGTETKELFFQFWDNPYTTELTPEPGTFFHPTYRVVGNGVNYSFSQNNSAVSCLGSGLLLEPGTYTIQINALPGVIDGISGHIEIRERPLKPNLIVQQYGAGVRVKNIRYLDGNNGNATREQHYNYNRFDAPTLSSGEIFQGDWEDDFIGRKIGAQVGYTNVTISNGEANGYTRHTYMSKDEPVNLDLPTNNFRNILCYQAGLLKKVAVYDATNRLLSVAENDYIFEHIGESFWIPSSNSLTYNYSTKLSWPKLNTRVSKSYNYTGSTANEIELTEQFTYHSSNRQIDEHTISYGLGETKKTKYYYHSGNSVHSKNRISALEKVENYIGSTLLSTSRINYATTFTGNASHLPQTIEVAKGNNSFEPKVRYQAYDSYGHPTQVSTENGLTTSYVWGYNKSMPIAVIENATNASIATALGTSFDNINESHLTALTNLRTNTAFATARITTYTHKPLVGVLTVTDPRGDKINYDYDTFNRLKWVKDKNNQLLSETEYYYKQTTTEQNYVKTKNYKVPTTSSIATPSLTQALEGITYFDGLGRTIQQQAKGQSATGKDIITHFEYDALGRQSKQYLPFASGQTNMAYVFGETLKASIISQYQTLYGDSNPYSETRFETSPLSRVLEQAAPGNDWAMANAEKHTIRFDYQTNSDADQVKLFKATTNWDAGNELYTSTLVNSSGTVYHPAHTLHKSVVKNENWKPGDGLANTTEEFKDKEGRVLLKRTYSISMVENVETAVWHETYNVYDEYGNLTYVIPPLADGAITDDVLNGLCYQYRYDAKNRLVEKKLPGKQWEFIVYDKLDRIVMTGPALSPFTSPTGNGWMITKYDIYNRPILTAWMSGTVTSATRKTQQVARNGATVFHETKTTGNITVNNVAFRYTTVSLPTSGYHVLTVQYYDNYDSNLTFTPVLSYAAIFGQSLYSNTLGNRPIGLPTISWVRVPESSTTSRHEKSYLLYDVKGRVIRTVKGNYLLGYTVVDSQLETITGRVNYIETKHKRVTADTELYIKDAFTYTAQDRLLTHTHQIGTGGTPQLLTKNDYNELGQLISKQVGGSDTNTFVGLQKVDYSYNIRGWLKGINDIENLSQSGSPTDLFAFKLNYNTIENENVYVGKELYNGNISETYWRTNNDNFKRKYSYHYDEQNRMKSAIYQRPNNSSPLRNNYDEHVFYDKNG